MGQCMLCSKPAGFLRKVHKECKKKHESGKTKIISLIENADYKQELHSIDHKVKKIAIYNYINKQSLKDLLITGWEQAVERAFDDGVLTEEEESNLNNFMEYYSLDQTDLDRNGAYTKIVKGAVLRDIMEGTIPERIKFEGNLPFNLQKTEKIIWIFSEVDYYEQKKRIQYVGGSRGVSIRIAKGVYYRTGGFKGERVETPQTLHVDTGFLGVTDKHIYFLGSIKSFRIRYDKIVSFRPFSDGIGLQKDAANAKPQLFITGDGWFTYNLIINVSQL